MTLPASPVTGNIDAATDDPKLARADLKANWDKVDQIITHLNGSDITNDPLTPGNGLQKNLTELEVQLQTAPGLKVGATGVAVDIDGSTAEVSPVPGDTVLFYDASAGALRKATVANMGKGLVLADISNVSASGPASGQALTWNGSAWAPANNAGAASVAEMEAASSTAAYASPGRQQRHPSACKIWCAFSQVGTQSIFSSYNTTSITDITNATTDINVATDFSNELYSAVSGGNGSSVNEDTLGVDGSVVAMPRVGVMRYVGSHPGAGVLDTAYSNVVAFGDQ